MGTFKLKRKYFTDELSQSNTAGFDNMRNMNDSQILSLHKRENPVGLGQTAQTVALGTAVGAGASMVLGRNKNFMTRAGRGAVVGGLTAAGIAAYKHHKGQEQVDNYNNRLDTAQRHAQYREKNDWNNRMLNNNFGNYTY